MMKKILIVDDKEVNRKVLLDFFKFFGRKAPLEIEEATSGAEAVIKALEIKPDLILMDINMETDYAGIDATVEIKSKLGNDNVLIWAVTSQAMKERDGEDSDKDKCLNGGCDRFFSKPYDQKEILYGIAEALDLTIPEKIIRRFEEDID